MMLLQSHLLLQKIHYALITIRIVAENVHEQIEVFSSKKAHSHKLRTHINNPIHHVHTEYHEMVLKDLKHDPGQDNVKKIEPLPRKIVNKCRRFSPQIPWAYLGLTNLHKKSR